MIGRVTAGADDKTPNEFVFNGMIVDDRQPTIID